MSKHCFQVSVMAAGRLMTILCLFAITVLLVTYQNINCPAFGAPALFADSSTVSGMGSFRSPNRVQRSNRSDSEDNKDGFNFPLYIRHNLTANVNCAGYFVNNSARNKKRIRVGDPVELKTDCASIESRFGYPRKTRSKEEAQFPIAFLRAVYRDYVFLETMFRAQYEPQNVYAFVLDSKSDTVFKKRIRDLADCYSNVVVADEEFDIKSNGKNVTRAFVAGFEALQKFDWRYVITLQNHDVIYKTNAELVRIFTAFGGANDISTGKHTSAIPPKVKFTIENMKLFQNETQNSLAHPTRLNILKSLIEVSISREAVDYIVDTLDTSTLIENLEKVAYGMDENFFATLNANEGVDLPGGFTTLCLDNGIHTQSITRTTTWNSKNNNCRSKKFRHYICIYGTEDLFNVVGQPGIVANKFMPEYDFGAVDCLMERMHNRSYGIDVPAREEIKLNLYKGLRHVRYHNARKDNGGKRPTKFKC